ncbi:hypothetical protein D3C72_1193700 [compost metagenome]
MRPQRRPEPVPRQGPRVASLEPHGGGVPARRPVADRQPRQGLARRQEPRRAQGPGYPRRVRLEGPRRDRRLAAPRRPARRPVEAAAQLSLRRAAEHHLVGRPPAATGRMPEDGGRPAAQLKHPPLRGRHGLGHSRVGPREPAVALAVREVAVIEPVGRMAAAVGVGVGAARDDLGLEGGRRPIGRHLVTGAGAHVSLGVLGEHESEPVSLGPHAQGPLEPPGRAVRGVERPWATGLQGELVAHQGRSAGRNAHHAAGLEAQGQGLPGRQAQPRRARPGLPGPGGRDLDSRGRGVAVEPDLHVLARLGAAGRRPHGHPEGHGRRWQPPPPRHGRPARCQASATCRARGAAA